MANHVATANAVLSSLDTESVVYLNEHLCSQVMKCLKGQREIGEHCDTTLVIKEQKFFAHRCVLAANSSYFQTWYQNPDMAREIVIPTESVGAFESLLDYMYTGQLSISVAIAEELMILSQKLGITDIKHCCNMHLEKHIDVSNWFSLLGIAERYGMADVVKSAEKCVVDNFFLISQGEEILGLTKESLMRVLKQCGNGDTDVEHNILTVIYRWVLCEIAVRSGDLADMLSIVDKQNLDKDKLEEMLETEAFQRHNVQQMAHTQTFLQEIIKIEDERKQEEARQKIVIEQEKKEQQEEDAREKADCSGADGHGEVDRKTLAEPPVKTVITESAEESKENIKVEKVGEDLIGSILNADDLMVANGQLSMQDFIEDDKGVETDNTEVYLSDSNIVKCEPTTTQVKHGKSRRRRKPDHPTKISRKGVQFTGPGAGDSAENLDFKLPVKRKRGRPRKYPIGPMGKPLKHELKTKFRRKTRTKSFGTQTAGEITQLDDNDLDIPRDDDMDPTKLRNAWDVDAAADDDDEDRGPKTQEIWTPPTTKRRGRKSNMYAKGSAEYIGNQYVCQLEGCRYRTTFRSRMQEHANAHLGIFTKRIVCVICNKEFRHSKHLRRHEIIHMDMKYVSCDLCDYKSARRDKLKEHLKRIHPERAQELGFLTLEAMNKVLKRKKEPKPRKPRRKRHKIHYDEDGSMKQEWACDKCPRRFPTPSALLHHKKGHGADTPFLCEHCGFSTIHFASINVHKRQHNGKKFVCDYPGCDYTAIRKSRLEDHRNAHDGIKNHVCSICGKAFAGKKHMQRHEKIHQEFKAIACEMCEYRTHRRDKLREHLRKHHPQEGMRMGILTMTDINQARNTITKSHKSKKKQQSKAKVTERELKQEEEEREVDPGHGTSSAAEYPQQQGSLLPTSLQTHAALPGTTTISEDMMQLLTSVSAGQSIIPMDQIGGTISVPYTRESGSVVTAGHSLTADQPILVQPTVTQPLPPLSSHATADQNLYVYYIPPAPAQTYP